MGASSNAYFLAADFGRSSDRAQGEANKITRHYAMLLQVRIQANASGRPGPRIITGDYNRSWNTTNTGIASIVGTNKPQARRLEYGFYGPDRLGRVYHQPPFPHVGPAVDVVGPAYHRALGQIIDDT